MKKYLNELEKISSINTQLQNKLGEITIWINNPNNLASITNSDTKQFILILQTFLCHKYYLDFMKLKPNENSTYDNCMNLILIVLAKICKINQYNGELMIKYFIDHINTHLECFNYIISFYRLYITSPQLKQCGKNEELYNYLFKLYKRLYSLNIEYEPQNNIKDINTIFKSGIIKNISGCNNLQDQKYLTEQYLQLTDRPINKILNNDTNLNLNNISDNYSLNNINSNSIGENFFQKDLKFNNNNNQFSNINKNSLSHIINSNSKSNILSRTDRKINNSNTNLCNNLNNNNTSNNNRQTSDVNNYSTKFLNYGINNQNILINKNINIGGIKENANKSLKPKIPTLKFPLDKTQPHQKFSLIRSSHRNDFSKSGDGSSTTTTKNKIFTNKLAEGSSMNRHFSQDVLILEPKEKLKELALQLGESCLATDFTSLINKKRDYEIEKYKKKTNGKESNKNRKDEDLKNENNSNIYVNGKNKNSSKRNNIPNSECQSSNKLNNYIEKINNLNENYNDNINNKVEGFNYNAPSKYDSKRSINNANSNKMNNISDNITIKEKQNYSMSSLNNNYQNFKNFIKVREIVTNFISSALKEYTEEEFNFLKIDIYTIFSYLLLPSMENLQNKSEKKKMEIIEQMKFILDKEKDSISFGNFLYLPEKIEINKKKFQLNNAYNGGNLKNMKSVNNIINKDNNYSYNKKEINEKGEIEKEHNKGNDNYNIFESLLSITFEEDNNCPLILKK